MSAEDELKQIKQILSQIRNQGGAGASPAAVSPNAADLDQYTRQLSLARAELENLEKGTSAYNRKQKEIESLTRKVRNAMKDQRQETDLLTLSTQGLSGAMSMLANTADTVVLKFAGAVKTVFDEAKKLDTITVEFRRTTGASAALASNIGELTDRMRFFGIDSAAAGQAIGTLHSEFTGFTQLNQAQQLEIGRTAALLGELGVSYQTTAHVFETSTRTLGLSLGETESLLIDLRSTAMALQVPIEQLTRDFAGAENMVAAMGVSGPKAFKDLAAASKATGVEMNTLLGITEKFDTFEGAAEAVQGLNAILGGNYLDSLSMVEETDPTKRFEMIRDAVFAAGHSVESLANSNDYYLKKSLAGVMGTDVSTFMKMLSGDVDELTGQVDTAAVSFEELSKEAFGLRGFDSVMNNLTGALARPVSRIQEATRATFEGFTPLIERFESFNEGLIEKTNAFVAKNSEMVGAVGILYNLGNIDGVQKGYEIFKGIAGFSGSVLSNLFSVKGLLAVMAGGVLFAIKDDFKEIGQAFTDDGFMGGLTAIWNVLTEKFSELQNYLDEEFGINENFLTKGLNVLKALAAEGYQYFNVYFLGPTLDYLREDLMPQVTVMLKKLLSELMVSVSDMFGGGFMSDMVFGADFGEKQKAQQAALEKQLEGMTSSEAREAKLNAAVEARRTAMGQFIGTRGAQTIESQATNVVEKVAPHATKAYEVVEDVAKSAKDAGFEFGKEMVQVFKEGVNEVGKSHINLEVHITEEVLDASVGRATASKLNSIGRGAIVNGSGS